MPGLIARLRRSSLVLGIVIVGALTLAARGMAVVRELVVAGTYGVGEELDAVFAALVIPITLIAILTSTVQHPRFVGGAGPDRRKPTGAVVHVATPRDVRSSLASIDRAAADLGFRAAVEVPDSVGRFWLWMSDACCASGS